MLQLGRVPVLRRLGFRTQTEIDEERYALKALRGDFLQADEAAVPPRGGVQQVDAGGAPVKPQRPL